MQLLSENNLAGGVRASREGRRRVKARISRWGEKREGREESDLIERIMEKVGSRKWGQETTVIERGIGVRDGSGGLATRPFVGGRGAQEVRHNLSKTVCS